MKKLELEGRIYAVREILEQNRTINSVAVELGLNRSTISYWVRQCVEHGLDGLNRRQQGLAYPGEFRVLVIQDMQVNNLSYREVAAKYNIGTHVTVIKWNKIFTKQGVEGLMTENKGEKPTGRPRGRPLKLDREEMKDLRKENERLKMEVAYLKKLNALVQEKEK